MALEIHFLTFVLVPRLAEYSDTRAGEGGREEKEGKGKGKGTTKTFA